MSEDAFERGLKKRRQVMGDAFVDRALGNANDLTMPMQQFVTEFAWDGVWNREHLSDRERSLINLGMLAALNRANEFRGHVRGALNNRVTPEELRDLCIQIAAYCGCPAGLEAMRHVNEIVTEATDD